MNDLSTFLNDRTQFDEITPGLEPGLLFKLANRGREQVFIRINLAFRNAPISLVLVFEQRPAGMDEKHLQLPFAQPIHQQAGADSVFSGHASPRFCSVCPRQSISLLSTWKIVIAMPEPMNGPPSQPVAGKAAPHLLRRFGLLQATALNMTNMIGIGPFITIPALMSALQGPQAMLGWLVAVLITVPDALVWSELGAALPGSGGSYVYLRDGFGRETFGRLMAFLFVWQFILSGPLEIASGYIGFAQYLNYLWPGMTTDHSPIVALLNRILPGITGAQELGG